MTEPVLEVRGLQKYFPVSTGNLLHRKLAWVKAVETVDFAIHAGETLGLIGESGCGKTTTAKLILLQEEPTAGRIVFDGDDVLPAAGSVAEDLPNPAQVDLRFVRRHGLNRMDPSVGPQPNVRIPCNCRLWPTIYTVTAAQDGSSEPIAH